MKRYLQKTLKIGLRLKFLETEGLFCKSADDVRPEAIAALLETSKNARALRREKNYMPIHHSPCGATASWIIGGSVLLTIAEPCWLNPYCPGQHG